MRATGGNARRRLEGAGGRPAGPLRPVWEATAGAGRAGDGRAGSIRRDGETARASLRPGGCGSFDGGEGHGAAFRLHVAACGRPRCPVTSGGKAGPRGGTAVPTHRFCGRRSHRRRREAGGRPRSCEAGLGSAGTVSAPGAHEAHCLSPPPGRPSLPPSWQGHADRSRVALRPGPFLSSPLARPPGFRAGSVPGRSVTCHEGGSLCLFCPPAYADAPGGAWPLGDTPPVCTDGTDICSEASRTRE